jgi:hypothetical protein
MQGLSSRYRTVMLQSIGRTAAREEGSYTDGLKPPHTISSFDDKRV